MDFITPDTKRIQEALGTIRQLPRDMLNAITYQIDGSFQSVLQPGDDDWLKTHNEKGQTMGSFLRCTSKAVPRANRNIIYIQPIGTFNYPRVVRFDVIAEFVRAFFPGCQVELLSTVDFSGNMKYRENNGVKQYRTKYFYQYLTRTRHIRNAKRELVCVAITMVDIYLNQVEDWVYGEARKLRGLAVYSFARLDPLYKESSQLPLSHPLTDEHRIIMTRRCVKVLLHELCHLFGLKHCIYYTCLMNGVNNEVEMDRQPLYLCPVCLRKLYETLRFNVCDLYEKFAHLCAKYELEEERIWYQKRLDIIRGSDK